jgi:outer membrane protein assembly factor BamB
MNIELNYDIGVVEGYSNLLTATNRSDLSSVYKIRSRVDFSVLASMEVTGKFAMRSLEHRILLTDLKERHIDILIDECIFNESVGDRYLVEKYEHYRLFYNPSQKVYFCYSNDSQVYKFDRESGIEYMFFRTSILQIKMRDSTNSWIKCIDGNNGNEKWTAKYPWRIARCEQFHNVLVVDYHAYENIRDDEGYEGQIHWSRPNIYTIVIDIETGHELWRKQIAHSKVDKQHGIILGGDRKILELDILSSAVLSEVDVVPDSYGGYFPHFVDEDSIYYTADKGAFGKIRKSDGVIVWEFQFEDDRGEKRKLSNWLLLSNGKLILESMIGEESFSCIFDPRENLEFATIRNGIKLK